MVEVPMFHDCARPVSNLAIFHPFAGMLSTLDALALAPIIERSTLRAGS